MSSSPTPSDGYERADARPKAIGVAVFVLLVVIVGSFFVADRLDRGWIEDAEREDIDPHPMAGSRRGPTAALLQVNPPAALEAWVARERAREQSYGWIDRDAGVVRLPIERAMELLVARAAEEDDR